FILYHHKCLSQKIVDVYTNSALYKLEEMIHWLMGWPAGLKLNNNLDKFLGELFLWILKIWTSAILPLKWALPFILVIIAFVSIIGLSLGLSLIIDIFSFSYFHFTLFYSMTSRIYHWHIGLLISLFHLFQGKKYNVLRNRFEPSDFSSNQLLLGTIMFTVLTFLFPTVFVYYLLF
ncbi:N-acetylglucosaminyl transferase component, partial [Rozella allomycis CSF55]